VSGSHVHHKPQAGVAGIGNDEENEGSDWTRFVGFLKMILTIIWA